MSRTVDPSTVDCERVDERARKGVMGMEEADDEGNAEKGRSSRLYAWAALLGALASVISALQGCGPWH